MRISACAVVAGYGFYLIFLRKKKRLIIFVIIPYLKNWCKTFAIFFKGVIIVISLQFGFSAKNLSVVS